jgi:hypothetical protein
LAEGSIEGYFEGKLEGSVVDVFKMFAISLRGYFSQHIITLVIIYNNSNHNSKSSSSNNKNKTTSYLPEVGFTDGV